MMKILDMSWEDGVRAEERKICFIFCPPLDFIFQSPLGVDLVFIQCCCPSIPESSSMKLILHQHHSCSEVILRAVLCYSWQGSEPQQWCQSFSTEVQQNRSFQLGRHFRSRGGKTHMQSKCIHAISLGKLFVYRGQGSKSVFMLSIFALSFYREILLVLFCNPSGISLPAQNSCV